MDSYYAFSDEAGSYDNNPSNRFIKSHPYYVRANILIRVDEYAEYQNKIRTLNSKFGVPPCEEIKWSDIWSKQRGKARNDYISALQADDLVKYFDCIFSIARKLESLKIILTFTKNSNNNIANKDTMMQFHLQEAFQRVNTELKNSGFATFIIDELPDDYSNQTKEVCHWLVEHGDIIKYTALYSGILFEKSNLSAGIQLADYIAGIFNSFLKSIDAEKDSYQYAKEKFHSFIKPFLRKSITGEVMGYGIREVTRDDELRNKIRGALRGEQS